MSFSSFQLLGSGATILVFGKDGQVGKALQNTLNDLKIPTIFIGRAECDLADEWAIKKTLNQYQPHVVINAAAYTAVDQAEKEPELAYAINAKAPEIMAHYVATISHGVFVHYSTDYVFDGAKDAPYVETDVVKPLGVYGQTKLAGEKAIEEAFNLAHDSGHASYQDKFSRYFILRTSWVYGEGGNFIRTMLRLASEREALKVVVDQVGAPSSAQWLAEIGLQMAGSRVESGIYHAVPDGETSWYGLAMFAIEIAATAGEGIKVKPENIQPIPATQYPMPAARPYNSRLDNTKLKQALAEMAFIGQYPKWQPQVEQYVKNHVRNALRS